MKILKTTNVIKENTFETARGKYKISILRNLDSGDIFFMKTKDGNLVELINLSKKGDYDPCQGCRHFPPSSTDGKPCSMCDTDDPYLNCYSEAQE